MFITSLTRNQIINPCNFTLSQVTCIWSLYIIKVNIHYMTICFFSSSSSLVLVPLFYSDRNHHISENAFHWIVECGCVHSATVVLVSSSVNVRWSDLECSLCSSSSRCRTLEVFYSSHGKQCLNATVCRDILYKCVLTVFGHLCLVRWHQTFGLMLYSCSSAHRDKTLRKCKRQNVLY